MMLRHWAPVNIAQAMHCTHLEGIIYMIVCSGQKYAATLRPHPVPTLYYSTAFFHLPAMCLGLLVGLSNVRVCLCKQREKKKKRERRGERETDWREEGKRNERCNRSQ